MRTPDGRECKFFYGDYYRGRNYEECRALASTYDAREWTSHLCKQCKVPDILRNNACPNLVLTVAPTKLLFVKRIKLFTYCTVSHGPVQDPNIGCGHCHLDSSTIGSD
jgi:hypothetical protein